MSWINFQTRQCPYCVPYSSINDVGKVVAVVVVVLVVVVVVCRVAETPQLRPNLLVAEPGDCAREAFWVGRVMFLFASMLSSLRCHKDKPIS